MLDRIGKNDCRKKAWPGVLTQPHISPETPALALLRASAHAQRWNIGGTERTADCPQKSPAGVTRACGAVMPDLVDLS
jgi:hypothetical protein